MSAHVLTPTSQVLVTGVTGLIGGEIVRRLAKAGVRKIWVLTRPTADFSVAARFADRICRSGDVPGRYQGIVEVVAGDVQSPQWNLHPRDLQRITRSVDVIIHCAADTSFIRKDSVLDTNVAGTINLIELAQQCARQPLVVYMSTASNVGKVTHCCLTEDEGCNPDNEHHNPYTRSKAVAESLLRNSSLDVLTLRPTVVLSAGLPDARFARNILWFAPLLSQFDALPIDPASRLDIVPASFVADATVQLLSKPQRRYDCYHLSAGEGNVIDTATACEVIERYQQRSTPLCLIPPAQWTKDDYRAHVQTAEQRKIFFGLRFYLPFWNMDVVYDNTRLAEELGARALVPPATAYLGELLGQISMDEALAEAARP